jgi:hypothetical protein
MSRQNPFGIHRQSVWHERSANPRLPDWIRIAALAFGSHKANGHAPFKSGELAVYLGLPGQPLKPSEVSNAIRLAKTSGWIAEESNARCLVVPPHAVEGGLGDPRAECPVHHKSSR